MAVEYFLVCVLLHWAVYNGLDIRAAKGWNGQGAGKMKKDWAFKFRILMKKEEDLWVAHCLELDLVATALSEKQVEEDIVAVILEQVRYCIVNDNMANLFRNAPKEIWDEFYACEKNMKPRQRTVKAPRRRQSLSDFPPISFMTSACKAPASSCRA
jgi:hypothetical protein